MFSFIQSRRDTPRGCLPFLLRGPFLFHRASHQGSPRSPSTLTSTIASAIIVPLPSRDHCTREDKCHWSEKITSPSPLPTFTPRQIGQAREGQDATPTSSPEPRFPRRTSPLTRVMSVRAPRPSPRPPPLIETKRMPPPLFLDFLFPRSEPRGSPTATDLRRALKQGPRRSGHNGHTSLFVHGPRGGCRTAPLDDDAPDV